MLDVVAVGVRGMPLTWYARWCRIGLRTEWLMTVNSDCVWARGLDIETIPGTRSEI